MLLTAFTSISHPFVDQHKILGSKTDTLLIKLTIFMVYGHRVVGIVLAFNQAN